MAETKQQKRKLTKDQQNVIPKGLWEKFYTMQRLEKVGEGKGPKLWLSAHHASRAMQDILPLNSFALHNTMQEELSLFYKQGN